MEVDKREQYAVVHLDPRRRFCCDDSRRDLRLKIGYPREIREMDFDCIPGPSS